MGSDYTSFLNQRSQKYFSDLSRVNCTQSVTGNVDDLNEKIQLKVSIAQTISNATYQVQIFNLLGDSRNPLCESLTLTSKENNMAYLEQAILTQYYFEKEQPLLIEIKVNKGGNTLYCQINTTLGCIMGARKNTFQKQLTNLNNELLIISAEKLKQSEDVLVVKFQIQLNKVANFSTPKNKLFFEISKTSSIYRSECLNNEGIFSPIKIPAGLLQNGFLLSFYNCKRKVIFKLQTSLQDISSPNKSFTINMGHGLKYTFLSKCSLTKNYTFVDYLKAGVQIGLSVAVDFTGSNGLPNDSRSLHFIGGNIPNQYERAINFCGSIVAYYDYDQLFPCFGFGAKINGQSAQLFNLNFQQNPNVHLIPGIIDAYHFAITNVQLWGPTNFSPIIRTICNMIKQENDKLKYNILMILTDGMIDDIDNTVDDLVDGSFLPLSVIIIGVGKADFTSMNVLDADENPLISSKGVKAARDLVQFVPFLKYENDPTKLASEVLAEVPKQILEYYEQNNLDPVKLTT